MARASTCNTSTSCSGCSSVSIRRPSSRAPVSGSRPCVASSTGTADGSGPKAPSIRARRFTSRCEEARVNPGKILLVEDNPDDVALTLRALKSHNITNEVIVAQDGVEAIDYLFGAKEQRAPTELPAVVLLDLKLPKINGMEVLQRIRSEERTTLLPVVILTSSDEERDVIDGYKLGANSYVRKPVDFVEFTKAAQQLGLYWLLMNRAAPSPRGP